MVMCPSYCRLATSSHHRQRRTAHSRLGTLLCLVAFALQLVLPAVHTWEVATHDATALSPGLRHQATLTAEQDSAALSQPHTAQQHRSHNPVLCSVCQALSHSRHYLHHQAAALAAPVTSSQIMAAPAAYTLLQLLTASPSRAPPFSS